MGRCIVAMWAWGRSFIGNLGELPDDGAPRARLQVQQLPICASSKAGNVMTSIIAQPREEEMQKTIREPPYNLVDRLQGVAHFWNDY